METGEKRIEYELIEDLEFDPLNPRLPSSLDKNDEVAIIRWMLRDAAIIQLMESIGERGYFPGEPLLVTKTIEDGKFSVVEGNRRLSAVKLLANPERAPTRGKSVQRASEEARVKPKKLPVIKYPTREKILDYLGYRHITGIKEWDPLAKARYLSELREQLEEKDPQRQFKILAKQIGSRSDYVAKLLTGLSLYNKIVDVEFFDIRDLDEETIDFSLLTTALNYSNFVTFLGLESPRNPDLHTLVEKHLEELTRWMFEKVSEGKTRLGESRNLKELSAIVANKAARTAFRDGMPLKDAVLLTGEPTEVFRQAIAEARQRLETARDHEHLVQTPTQTDSDQLRDVINIARLVRASVESKLAVTDTID